MREESEILQHHRSTSSSLKYLPSEKFRRNRKYLEVWREEKEKEKRRTEMGMERNPLFVGLILVLFFGVAVYWRLWAIDFSFSKDENDLIRKQFDLAHREAMEESAEWRLKYDEEVERGTQRLRELIQLKESLEQKMEETENINNKLTIFQEDNGNLQERVESLTKQLENLKFKCSTRTPTE